jgi:hypothetical protein
MGGRRMKRAAAHGIFILHVWKLAQRGRDILALNYD